MEDAKDGRFLSPGPVRTLGNRGSHMWLSNNRTPVSPGVRLGDEVGHLDGQLPVDAHLLHHLVEEVFPLWVRA